MICSENPSCTIRIIYNQKFKYINVCCSVASKNTKQLTEKLVYMPWAGIAPTSPSFLVRSVNHYTIRDHHAGNVAVWLVKLVNTWGFLGPIFLKCKCSSKILALECCTVNSRVNKVYWLIDWCYCSVFRLRHKAQIYWIITECETYKQQLAARPKPIYK